MEQKNLKSIETTCFSWNLDDSGLLTIEGTAEIPHYGAYDPDVSPWYAKKDAIRELRIGEGIPCIGRNAFRGCTNLKKAVLPHTLKHIHAYAFQDCISLEQIDADGRTFRYIYDTGESLRADSSEVIFHKDTFLRVPWARIHWGDYYVSHHNLYLCFSEEKNLILPEEIHTLKPFSLSHKQLQTLTLPDGLKHIEEFVFTDTAISERLYLPENLKSCSSYAFAGLEVFCISLPDCWEQKDFSWQQLKGKIEINHRSDPFEFAGYIPVYSVKTAAGLKTSREVGGWYYREMTRYPRILVRENRIVHHIDGRVEFPGTDTEIAVAERLLHRLKIGQALIGIVWEKIGADQFGIRKKVKEVKSYAINQFLGCIMESSMTPVQDEKGKVFFWSTVTGYLGEDEFCSLFPEKDGERLAKTEGLRLLPPKMCEEWFVSKSAASETCETILNLWIQQNHDHCFFSKYHP